METTSEIASPIESPKVVNRHVLGEFETLQLQIQQGIPSCEARIGAYGRFLHRLNYFLEQPSLENPSPEEKEVIERLIYRHQETASVPLDFLIELGEKVTKEVLDDQPGQRMGGKWPEELKFIRESVGQELGKATLNFNTEKEAVDTLRALARKAVEDVDQQPFKGKIRSIEERRIRIQESAIAVLSRDPNFSPDFTQSQHLRQALQRVLDVPDLSPQMLKEMLSPYSPFLAKPDGSSWVDDVYVRLSLGQNEGVKETLQGFLTSTEKPDFLWNYWADKGVISRPFLESAEEILTLLELEEVAKVISDLPREVKAKHLVGYLNQGVSGQLLLEIAGGRYEFPAPFTRQQVESFLHFYDAFESGSKAKTGMSLKTKIAMAAAVGLITASPFIFDRLGSQAPLPNQTEEEQFMPPAPTPTPTPAPAARVIIEGRSGSGSAPGGLGSGGVPGQGGSGEARPSAQEPGESAGPPQLARDLSRRGEATGEGLGTSADYSGKDRIEPRNSSTEDLKNAEKIVLWNLVGGDLNGYYREQVSSRFLDGSKTWYIKEAFGQRRLSPVANRDIRVRQTLEVTGSTVLLPIKENYKMVEVQVDGANISYSVVATEAGNISLYFPQEQFGKTIIVTYSLEKSSSPAAPPPTALESQDMLVNLVDINSLPDDVQKLMRDLAQNSSLSQLEKAKTLEGYIKENFRYSLDSRWSDFYHQAGSANDFIRRIFTIGKTDCDVANTALLALVRGQKIPARMAFGFIHKAGGEHYEHLRASEKHGWVEAYIDNQWVTLDGTPVNQDEYTRENLVDQPGQGGEMEEIALAVESSKAWVAENQIASALILAQLLNLLAFGAGARLRKQNNAEVNRLIEKVTDRARKYCGDQFPQVAHQLSEGDRRKLLGEKKGGNIAGSVLPLGFGTLTLDLLSKWRLNRVPYAQPDTLPVEPSAEPNAADFFVNALGYPEETIKKELRGRAYREIDEQVLRWRDRLVYGNSPYWYLYDPLIKTLDRMPVPKDEEEWTKIKEATAKRARRLYLKVYKRIRKAERKDIRRGREPSPPPAFLSEEEFNTKFEEIAQCQILRWQMK